MRRTLQQMDGWIDQAQQFAASRSFDPNVLLQARLFPDMFPLVRQYGSACDAAKFAAARRCDKAPPAHPDDQTTWEQVRVRVRDVLAYLGTYQPADFEGDAERLVPLRFPQGKALTAEDYLLTFQLPNFYFHATTAYAILRHNGVPLGKATFLGDLPVRNLE